MILKSAVFWGMVGVVLGFLLSVAAEVTRRWLRIRRLKQALRAECESLIAQIPFLIDTLQKRIDLLENEIYLPGPDVRGISIIYDATIGELASNMSAKERNALHIAYQTLRIGDKIVASYVEDAIEMIKSDTVADTPKAFTNTFKDLIKSYEIASKLLQSYLDGDPVDVFQIDASKDGK